MDNQLNSKPVRLIYNPQAGKKRQIIRKGNGIILEDILDLLNQYQIPVECSPTKRAGHAYDLAVESAKKKEDMVIVAGGDGTVSEVVNGLAGTETKLAIIPMGSFMNIAKMLSIPFEIEKAVQLIKIGRTRKIDLGLITQIDGEKLKRPYYFVETAGIGIDAQFHREFNRLEKGNIKVVSTLIKKLINFYANSVTIRTDTDEKNITATLITIANGPYTGANFMLAPKAKLNDHLLTITLYKMTKLELAAYLFNMKFKGKVDQRRLHTFQTKSVKISSKHKILVHADASLFGTTPIEVKIVPNALSVICGFPRPNDPSILRPRTLLDP